jgi:hypothetical protein
MRLSGWNKAYVDALTLDERKQTVSFAGADWSSTQRENAQRRLSQGKKWFVSTEGQDRWAEFLERVDLKEVELLQLAEPASLPEKGLPGWTATLSRLIAGLEAAELESARGLSDAHSLAAPAVAHCWSELSRSSQDIRLLSRAAAANWRNLLLARLAGSAYQIVKWEKQNGLNYQDNSARSPACYLSDRFSTFELLNRYPGLGRLWAIQMDNWTSFISDFVNHTKQFVRKRGLDGAARDRTVSQLFPDLSDPHHGNRSVVRVRLRDGSLWFYKPRCGLDERAWYRILRSINKHGFPVPFTIVEVIPGDRHCWMQAIAHKVSRRRNEVRAFFYRAGGLLYLAHVFRAVDLHAGNLIAHGEQPILVDCETFLHPTTRVPKLARWSASPLVRTGLLPAKLVHADGDKSVSAFGRRLVGAHRQEWRGRGRFAGEYIEDFLGGFKQMRSIADKLDLGGVAAKLFPKNSRIVYRPTHYYQLVHNGSLAPRTLMNGFDRSLFLHAACPSGVLPRRCVQSEIKALTDGDIPLFHGRRCPPGKPPSADAMRRLSAQIRVLLCQ